MKRSGIRRKVVRPGRDSIQSGHDASVDLTRKKVYRLFQVGILVPTGVKLVLEL